MNKVLFSSEDHSWETPQHIVDQLGVFDLDVAATQETAKAPRFFTKEDDALKQKWEGRIWLNPPYGRQIPLFLQKAYEESLKDYCDEVCVLIPSRTDTRWFHQFAPLSEVFFIKGRIKFLRDGKAEGSPAFPSLVMRFNGRNGFHLLDLTT